MHSNRPFHFTALRLLIVQLAWLVGPALAEKPTGRLNVLTVYRGRFARGIPGSFRRHARRPYAES